MKNLFKRKMFLGAVLTLISVSLVLAGCGNSNNGSTPSPTVAPTQNTENAGGSTPTPEPEKKVSGTVTIAGSTSVQPLAEELGNAFMELDTNDARIEVAGGGSGAGVKAAQTSTADIGMASREIKEDETGITPIVIAIDGIAVVVNPSNANAELTLEQIQGIFSGKITKWSEVGGSDANIVVVNREEGSGTRDAFAEIVLKSDPFVAEAIIQNSTGAVREAVSQDVNAIGYISLGGLNDSVKAVKVNGVDATEENIKGGTYPIARPFNFLVNDSKAPSDAAQAFIDYILGEGQSIVAESGYVTVN